MKVVLDLTPDWGDTIEKARKPTPGGLTLDMAGKPNPALSAADLASSPPARETRT
jgi:hypothetical protein